MSVASLNNETPEVLVRFARDPNIRPSVAKKLYNVCERRDVSIVDGQLILFNLLNNPYVPDDIKARLDPDEDFSGFSYPDGTRISVYTYEMSFIGSNLKGMTAPEIDTVVTNAAEDFGAICDGIAYQDEDYLDDEGDPAAVYAIVTVPELFDLDVWTSIRKALEKSGWSDIQYDYNSITVMDE